MGELAGAAHFWAIRSCEYAKVPKAEQRQMKQLCIRNIAFIKDGESVDHKSLSLHLADCVLVTFKPQKSEVSPWLCVKGNFCDHVMLSWLRAQSLIPSAMWLWSSGKMDTTTQNKTPSATLQDFYDGN